MVIKIGSALLVDPADLTLRDKWLQALAADIASAAPKPDGNSQDGNNKALPTKFIIVTSGSIALGRSQLGWHEQKLKLDEKQAAAAIGQSLLMEAYQHALGEYGLKAAQILLTPQDTEQRNRHLNARQAILQLLEMNYIPVINENDTVTTAEIRYGDNDRLAARVAAMVSADLLILLSDVDGLYTADPRLDKDAAHLPTIEVLDPSIMAMGGKAPKGNSSGGMETKLQAAKIAMQAGCDMIIMKGKQHHPLQTLTQNDSPSVRFSLFKSQSSPMQARKSWIAGTIHPKGSLTIDQGAWRALQAGNSLLPSGVIAVTGDFDRGDALTLHVDGDDQDKIIGIGLSAYDDHQTSLIMGHHSNEIPKILGFSGRPTLIHRDDLALLD